MRHAVSVFCAWLERTPFSHLLQTIEWIIPAVQTLHLLAIAALMGATLVLNLRLLGVLGADVPVERISRRFIPVVKAALCLLLLTGVVMIAAEPARSLLNPAFQLKMALQRTLGRHPLRGAVDRVRACPVMGRGSVPWS